MHLRYRYHRYHRLMWKFGHTVLMATNFPSARKAQCSTRTFSIWRNCQQDLPDPLELAATRSDKCRNINVQFYVKRIVIAIRPSLAAAAVVAAKKSMPSSLCVRLINFLIFLVKKCIKNFPVAWTKENIEYLISQSSSDVLRNGSKLILSMKR